jgi:type VI secretion system secreted protein VgrG
VPDIHELTLTCSAFGDEPRLLDVELEEAISSPTRARLRFSAAEDLDLEAAIGVEAVLGLSAAGELLHEYHLQVTAAELTDVIVEEGGLPRYHYAAELEHELAALRLRRDVRMFQDKDAREIVAEVLEAAGIPADHVTYSVQRAMPKRPYCIQYRESDFDFISRLMEEEGIFYFIIDDGAPHLTISDAQSAFEPIAGDSAVAVGRGHDRGVESLAFETRPVPEGVIVNDYNFRTPSSSLEGRHLTEDGNGEWYEYPGRFATAAEGNARAKIIAEELKAHSSVGSGRSNVMTFRAGAWVELEGTRRPELAGKFLLIAVSLAKEGDQLVNRFRLIPHARPFRPQRRTPRPQLRGLHSAVVTGPSGSEIHVDDMGQMKAKFFWDRVGADDDTSSTWLRVAQLPIDGSMALARVGWEMGIAYVDGDPDRPHAVARLYNGEKTSPYGYPAAKTRMSLQTPTSPGGGSSNEIRMEDAGGGQELFINSTKDMSEQINNNRTMKVGVDHKVDIGANLNVAVTSTQSVKIGSNKTVTVSAGEEVSVTGDRTKKVGGSESVTVSGAVEIAVSGSDKESVSGSYTTLAALGIERNSESSQTLNISGSFIQAAGQEIGNVTAGARSETVAAAKVTASAAAIADSVIGACATTVGGALVQAAGGARVAATKGAAAITVGGLLDATGASKVYFKGKKINILVAGVANFVGGGGALTLTAGSASFGGLVTVDASGAVKISGNPNLMT